MSLMEYPLISEIISNLWFFQTESVVALSKKQRIIVGIVLPFTAGKKLADASGEVHIISPKQESGRKLDGLGGLQHSWGIK